MSGKILGSLGKGLTNTSNILCYIGMGMLLVLMLLGTSDVIGRYVFNSPITGTLEMSEILLAGVIFFGWGITQIVKAHVTVTIVTSRLPHRTQAILDFIINIVLLVIFGLIIWQGTKAALKYLSLGRMVMNINAPIFIFQLFVPFGAFIVCLVLLVQIYQSFVKIGKVD